MTQKFIPRLSFLFFIVLVGGFALADDIAGQYKEFIQVEEKMHRLADLGESDEAFKILNAVRDKFPDDEYQIMDWLVYFNRVTGQYNKCLNLWSEGHRKGYFFGIYPSDPQYQVFYDNFRFMKIADKDEQMRVEALKTSKCIYEVRTPENYSPEKKYPVLIALHGGWGTTWHAKKYWRSDKLYGEFILVFIQSYLYYDYNSFGWADYDPRAREDFQKIFSELKEKYSIDTTRVIIGGISAGGVMATDVAINNILPVIGLVDVCAGKPKEFDLDKVTAAKKRGLRVYLVSGKDDYLIPEQEEMVKLFDETGLPYQYHIIDGLGHAYPTDFPVWIDKAVDYIENQ